MTAKTESEVDLCDRLRDWAERQGFDVYPEVHGWDLVLTTDEPRKLDRLHAIEPGQQVGIHAKVRASFEVIDQAWPPGDGIGWKYPTYGMVAVPAPGAAFERICRRVGIGVIAADRSARKFRGWIGSKSDDARSARRKHDPYVTWWPRARTYKLLTLPPIASRAIQAGAPSPRVLSEWRTKALRFLASARSKETFRVSDVTAFGLSKTWVDRWGEPVDWATENRRGKPVRVRVYRLVTNVEKLPDWGYRDVAEELWKHDASMASSAGGTDR